jgi:hypothetical protein
VSRARELTEKGVVEYARGFPEEAERLWRDALAVDPGCERARAYLEQVRGHPAGGFRPPGAPDVGPSAVTEVQPGIESGRGSAPPPRDPARFSLAPEKLAPVHRPILPIGARKALLLAAAATALLVAIAGGLRAASAGGASSPIMAGSRAAAAASAALAALPGEAVRIVDQLRGARGPAPAVSRPPAEVVASGPSQQRGGSREGRKTLAPTSRAAGSGQPAARAAPSGVTLAQAVLGTRWGMSLEEVLTVLPSASRVTHPARSGERRLTVEARVDRVELGGRPYRAEFLFDPAGRLGAIQVRSILGAAGDAAYEGLRAGLLAELGEPSENPAGPASPGRRVARSSWETSRGGVDLEVRKLGLDEAPVLLVDLREGDVRPIGDGMVVLTLVAPGP